MSIESRLLRGDDPEDVAKLFNVDVEYAKDLQKKLQGAAKKKAPKKKAARAKK